MSDSKKSLDYLFEVSWEVCNKVGGIHTVVSTKASTVGRKLGDKYILVGPDISIEGGNQEFEEDVNLFAIWRKALYNDGIRIRVGRWKIEGSPIVVLVDFTTFFSKKDEVLAKLWERYNVDSISGAWDYVESIPYLVCPICLIRLVRSLFGSSSTVVMSGVYAPLLYCCR